MAATMSFWSRLIDRLTTGDPEREGPRALPGEPNVFECRACGKVFESDAARALCPECDSPDVARVS